MNDLIYRLLLFLNSCKEKNINYTIATIILHNAKDVSDMSINQLAEMCYTSPAAISRFCKKLGYANLAQLKNLSKSEVKMYELKHFVPKGVNYVDDRDELVNKMRNDIKAELDKTVDSLDLKIIDRVLELIYSHENIYLFGTRYSQLMIQDLQYKFASLGKLMNVAQDVQEQEKMAKDLDEKSLSILISPTGRFVKYHEPIWQNIEKSKSKLVVLTQKKNQRYQNTSNYIINFSQNTEGYGYIEAHRYSLAYIVEYMYMRYYSLYFNHRK